MRQEERNELKSDERVVSITYASGPPNIAAVCVCACMHVCVCVCVCVATVMHDSVLL